MEPGWQNTRAKQTYATPEHIEYRESGRSGPREFKGDSRLCVEWVGIRRVESTVLQRATACSGSDCRWEGLCKV